MKAFVEIYSAAEKRKGGKVALRKLLPPVLSKKQLLAKGDDRYLAMMTKVINQAGFRWAVIEKKWPQFEDAFFQFNITKLSLLSPEQWEAYLRDTRVVRHGQKINAVMENVAFVYHESLQRGSFAHLIADWPTDDQVGLMRYLKKHGSRLGGNTGQRFLRYMGKDAFILTQDVVYALQHSGIDIADNPTSQRDLNKVQEAMNRWHQDTQLPYAHLSKLLAYSVGVNYEVEQIHTETSRLVEVISPAEKKSG